MHGASSFVEPCPGLISEGSCWALGACAGCRFRACAGYRFLVHLQVADFWCICRLLISGAFAGCIFLVHFQVADFWAQFPAALAWWDIDGSVGLACPVACDLFLFPYSGSLQESVGMARLPLLMTVFCIVGQ